MPNELVLDAAKKALRYPPTPWINADTPITQVQYRFRLCLHRRNGAIRLEMSPKSPTSPGQERVVRRGKPGFFEFVQAADALLDASKWDPTCDHTSPYTQRPMWNKNRISRALCTAHIETLLLYVDRLLHPRRGRPLSDAVRMEREARNLGQGGRRTAFMATRMKRKGELLTAHSRMVNILLPIDERLNARWGMKGYTEEETQQLKMLSGEVRAALNRFEDVVRYDKFSANLALMAPPDRTAGDAVFESLFGGQA